MSTELPPAATETERELRVAAKVPVAEAVVALELEDPRGDPLPAWAPGAHVELALAPGLARQYSLCGSRADRWRIAVLREPDGRGGSAFVHDRLAPGSPVAVRGPRNRFPLIEADRYVFVAGGIGITPILPMVEAVAGRGRDWTLLYGGRTRASMAFVEELERHGDRVAIRPQDRHGLLDLQSLLAQPRAGTAVYCCGPEPLLAAVERHCAAWPQGALHVERFEPRAHTPAGPEHALEVVLERSGVTLTVPPDQSILEACEAAGLPVVSSCREGTCGTCETAVLEGSPDHRDSLLTDAERERGDRMMICVSRARSRRIVLDI